MATWELNSFLLTQEIEAKQARLRMKDVELAQVLGVSPSTILRTKSGAKPSADVLLSILIWLRMPAARFAQVADE